MIPDYGNSVSDEERSQAEWDKFLEDLPVCKCCGRSVYPGDYYHETRNCVVCASCVWELNENKCILEV